MRIQVETIATDPARALACFHEAIVVYDRPIPTPSPECPFCLWYDKVKPYFDQKRAGMRKQAVDTPQQNLFGE